MKNDPIKQSKLITEYEKLCGVRQGSAYAKSQPHNAVQVTQEDIAKLYRIIRLGLTKMTLQSNKERFSVVTKLVTVERGGVYDRRRKI